MAKLSLDDPQAPAATLTIGSVLWKALDWVGSMDFLLSVESKTFLVMFIFFADYGWWILMIIGGVWWFTVHKNPPRDGISPLLIVSVALIAFLWGVVVTVYATGKVPNVIVGYGSSRADLCLSDINMDRLLSFQKDFEIALICLVKDPSIDKLKDPAISLSKPRTIHAGVERIVMPVSELMQSKIQSILSEKNVPSIWHVAVLLPKTVYLPSIKSLADVVVQKGKIIDPNYYDYKPSQ